MYRISEISLPVHNAAPLAPLGNHALRNEFIRLRLHGASLAKIGRHLGVSKPTLIKWNRQCQSEITSGVAAARQRAQDQAVAAASDEIAELTAKYNTIKQELLSRALRDVPTSHLEQLAGEFRKRLDALQDSKSPAHSAVEPANGTNSARDLTLPNKAGTCRAVAITEGGPAIENQKSKIEDPSEPIRTQSNPKN